MFLNKGGPRCGCGQYGDFEAFCSGTALGKRCKLTVQEMFAIYRSHGEEGVVGGIIADLISDIGRGLISINAAFNTRRFALGGSVFVNNQDILLDGIRKSFTEQSFKALTQGVEIVPCQLGDFVGDVGALSFVIPEAVIKHWQQTKPWEYAPEPVVIPTFKE